MMRIFRTGVFACVVASAAIAQTLPDGPGKETFESVCSVCHSPVAVIGLHKTKAEWKSKVTEMLQEQTDVPESDRNSIIEYLARSFPAEKLNINKASASEIATGLGLTSKDAAAIVQYRQDKGSYKAVDDLKKVPGIDTAKIDANRQLLEFE
jgi:competence protein ComEA